jgi:hypothetical protein
MRRDGDGMRKMLRDPFAHGIVRHARHACRRAFRTARDLSLDILARQLRAADGNIGFGQTMLLQHPADTGRQLRVRR